MLTMFDDVMPVRRSTLVVPANKLRMIEKAVGTEADVVMLDMEDAVAYTPANKTQAQEVIVEARSTLDFGSKELIVRVNALGSPWFEGDLVAAIAAHPRAIVPAKITSVAELREVDRRLMALGAPSDLRFWVGLETVHAVMRSERIALASPRVEVLRFGFGDYTATMQGQFPDTIEHLVFPLTKVLATARMYGFQATGPAVVFGDLKRLDLVRAQAAFLRRLGFDGATIIHPSHIAEVHAAFTPTADEIEWALRLEHALRDDTGEAVAVLDGHVVEAVHLKLANRTLAVARRLGLVSEPPRSASA
jgi:citrate lyase subunit beta/citryl-CoA lyase